MVETTPWRSMWSVMTKNGYPEDRDGWKIEYLISDYDGSPIKYRYVKVSE